jgi:hypothetical protein
MTTPANLPPMCGFFRRTAATQEAKEGHRIIHELMQFAESQRFTFQCVFVEESTSDLLGTWANMIGYCHASGVRDLVVPSLAHFDPSPTFAALVRDDLANEIQGAVWIVAATSAEAACDG